MTQQNLSNYLLNVGFANPTYQMPSEIWRFVFTASKRRLGWKPNTNCLII